ncbi:MAG: toll/interleukin-1 receptor domain-containing protein [Bacteroidales bacterium]|nr:toll/interleukin-1 receptor domain-containing protein [Bacteroidales bacterium]
MDFDELKDGKFDKRILEAIEDAPIFMIILSKGSLDRCTDQNDWVRQEILHAEEHRKHIIPIEVDKTFRSIPDYVPDDIKRIVGQHQFTQIDTETLFEASVNELVNLRIRPNLDREISEEPQEKHISGAEIHIETDRNCRVYRFHKEIMHAEKGKDNMYWP